MPWQQGVAEDEDGTKDGEEFSGSCEDGARQGAKVGDGGEYEVLCVCVGGGGTKHISLLGSEPSTSN